MAASATEAPLADFDEVEWNEFHELEGFSAISGIRAAATVQGLCITLSGPNIQSPGSRYSSRLVDTQCSEIGAFTNDRYGIKIKNKIPPGIENKSVEAPNRARENINTTGIGKRISDPDSLYDEPDSSSGGGDAYCDTFGDEFVEAFTEAPSADYTLAGSLEDLVNTFDDKVTKCFRDYDEQAEEIAPVQVRTEAELSETDNHSFWTLTGEYGTLLPISWPAIDSASLRRRSTLKDDRGEVSEEEPADDDDENSEEKEEEELYFTNDDLADMEDMNDTDDVICELEAMMEEGSGQSSRSSPTDSSGSQSPDGTYKPACYWMEDGLKRMTTGALRQLLTELETTVNACQNACARQLRVNEQLRYNKQLYDEFIVRMVSIQRKLSPLSSTDRTRPLQAVNNRYLTTIVPYKSSEAPPTIEELQVYIKILSAIDEDSSSVPGLLTDYILKSVFS